MQSTGVVDVVDEGADLALGVFAAAIGLAVDLLGFERMHEALGLGVVLRRSRATHAGVGADLAQAQGVVAAGVLHAAVGMMDQVLQRTATRGDGLVERLERQAGLQMIGERPADDFPGEGVHDHRQIDELLRQTDVGDVRDPDMIRRSEHSLARQIAHDLITMSAVRGARDERLVAQAQEIIEPHQPTHSLGVDDEAFALQLLSDPAIAVEAVGQCDAMDRIANVGVVALGFTRREMAIIAGPRQLCELTQMLNLMDRLLGRARRFVFALRLLRRAQIFDEREELVSPRAGAGP